MSLKAHTLIREAVAHVRQLTPPIPVLKGGAWFVWDAEKITATDPIGAVLIMRDLVPKEMDPKRPETMVRPGLIKAACEVLGVDPFWLYRFWMGFDRGFQIQFTDKDDKTTRDDVSEFGIALGRELSR